MSCCHGNFLTQGLNLGFLHYRKILYSLSQGSTKSEESIKHNKFVSNNLNNLLALY